VAFARIDILEESIAYIIMVTRIGEVGTKLEDYRHHDDKGDMFLRNLSYKTHTVPHPRRLYSS
jgi:hypothetical protein